MERGKKLTNQHRKTQKEIFAFCFNLFLILLVCIGLVILFTIAIPRSDGIATVADSRTFRFFTTDSNMLILITSCIYVICMFLLWNNKIKEIPLFVYIFKQIATVDVAITMFVTITILTPGAVAIGKYPVSSLYMGSNLFYHLVVPTVSILSFLLFETKRNVKLKHTLWSFIVIVIYGVFYVCMAYTHVGSDGQIPEEFDWYRFCSFSPYITVLIFVLLSGVNYLFSWLLWLGNKKINLKHVKG